MPKSQEMVLHQSEFHPLLHRSCLLGSRSDHTLHECLKLYSWLGLLLGIYHDRSRSCQLSTRYRRLLDYMETLAILQAKRCHARKWQGRANQGRIQPRGRLDTPFSTKVKRFFIEPSLFSVLGYGTFIIWFMDWGARDLDPCGEAGLLGRTCTLGGRYEDISDWIKFTKFGVTRQVLGFENFWEWRKKG